MLTKSTRKKPDQTGFAVVAVLIVIIVLGVISYGGYRVYRNHQDSTKSKQAAQATGQSSASSAAKPVACGTDQTCFEKKFRSCEPATLSAVLSDSGSSSDPNAVVTSYQIYGPKTDGCNMTLRYTKNPNPAWVNKDLTCNWDNKIAFADSIQKTFAAVSDKQQAVCTGSLVAILQAHD